MSDYKSVLMKAMYGDAAESIFARLQGLDPKLNQFIQEFVYDVLWRSPPLELREKALITVAALVAQSRPEQLRIHMTAFLNCGGTIQELRAVLIHLAAYCGFPAALAAFAVVDELVGSKNKDMPSKGNNTNDDAL